MLFTTLLTLYYLFEQSLLFFAFGVNAVTMQAQAVAPPDMVCKDKFLIQSTVVPVGTTDEDITASMVSSCSDDLP